MFGKYKEIVLENLSNYFHSDRKKFNSLAKDYQSLLESDRNIRDFDDIYTLIEESSFEDQNYAKAFLEESVSYLKGLKKKNIKKLKNLFEDKDRPSQKNQVRADLDSLVFSKNIEEKTNSKIRLLNHLTGQQDGQIDEEFQPIVDSLIERKIRREYGDVDEEEMSLIKSYLNGDSSTLKESFTKVVDKTLSDLDEKKSVYKESDKKDLIEKSKEKLNEMKHKTPEQEDIENLLNLRS